MLSILFVVWVNVFAFSESNLTNHPANDRYASYSPDGNSIVFESDRNGNWDLFVMNSDGSEQRQLTENSFDDRRPSWHPDGNQIVFESNASGKFQLMMMNLSTRAIRPVNIAEMKGEPIFASISPDGGSIAYSQRLSEDSSKIVIQNLNNSKYEVVADFGFRSFYPRWSPDGKQLLFFSRHETDNKDDELYIINLQDNQVRRLTNWPKHNFCPAWSPDGGRMAYVQSMEGIRPEVYIMKADGTGVQRVTHNNDGDTLPNWSPDGEKLLLTAYRNGNFEIVTIALSDQ